MKQVQKDGWPVSCHTYRPERLRCLRTSTRVNARSRVFSFKIFFAARILLIYRPIMPIIGRLPPCYPPPMQVTLTPHGEELVEAALARGLGRSPEEVVERALETIAREDPVLSEEEKERRRQ